MATKVFKLDKIVHIPDEHEVALQEMQDTVSEVEAEIFEVDLKNLTIASIEDCKQQVEKYGPDSAYMGIIEVKEGIYEFDFDENMYKEVKENA